jgi:hypothetical protein
MIYEFILPITRQHTVKLGQNPDLVDEPNHPSTLMKQTLSTAILTTCSTIRAEAQPIMSKKLAIIEQKPLRIQCNMGAFPSDFMFTLWLTEPSIVDPPLLLCESHWKHFARMPRTFVNSQHLEIAVDSFSAIHTNDSAIFTLWGHIWALIRLSGVSCAIYHKNTLPPVLAGGLLQVPGMTAWIAHRRVMIMTEPLEKGQDPDDIVKVLELKDEEWDQMVEE